MSEPAVRALSYGAHRAGYWLNTGEGGLSLYHLEGGCDLVFQIGTAKFGVCDAQGGLGDRRLREVAAHDWALAVGTDFVVSARGFMFALGCIQALQCNKNTCPTGITTHDPKLQKGLDPKEKAQRVGNYVKNMKYEVGLIAHSCGVKEPRQLRRFHARVVLPDGKSLPLDELYPDMASAAPHGHEYDP